MVRRAVVRRQVRGGVKVKKPKATESLATVTSLVRIIFDSMFQGQIDEKGALQKKRRCGICEVEMDNYCYPLGVKYKVSLIVIVILVALARAIIIFYTLGSKDPVGYKHLIICKYWNG